MRETQIIDRGRGPKIAATRITVYHIWEFYQVGESRDDSSLVFGLSSRQAQAAIDDIAAHGNKVKQEYANIQERISQGNFEWVEKQLHQNREKLQKGWRERAGGEQPRGQDGPRA